MADHIEAPELGYAELYISTGASDVFERYGNLYTINLPAVEFGERDDTHLGSTIVEYGLNLPDVSVLEFTLPFNPGSTMHTALEGLRASKAIKDYKVVLGPDSGDAYWAAAGRILAIAPGIPINDKRTMVVRVRCTELPVFGTEV